MLLPEDYTLEVVYEDDRRFIDKVDPDRYSYLCLLQDVYKLYLEIKYDFPICVLGSGMHVETDEDILEMFRKYKDNPHIPIIVYERVDPLKIVKPNETQLNVSKERERPETHALENICT